MKITIYFFLCMMFLLFLSCSCDTAGETKRIAMERDSLLNLVKTKSMLITDLNIQLQNKTQELEKLYSYLLTKNK